MFNHQWNDVRTILQRNWNILTNDVRTAGCIPNKPLLTARRARNIRDRVTRSHFKQPKVSLWYGTKLCCTFPCGDCSICPFLISKDKFINPMDRRTIKLCGYTNCCSRSVIYGILCTCPKIYVEQTGQELRKRILQHLPNIALAKRDSQKGKKLTSIAQHFLQVHNSCTRGLKIIGLTKIWPSVRGGNITKRLLQIEAKWIHNLDCLTPKGLNEELLFTGFYKQ